MDTIERLERLESRERIRDLKARYAQLCDSGYDGKAIAELFTEEASWASSTYPVVRGREAIGEFMDHIGREVYGWAAHYLSNPRIDVADDLSTARGRWELLQLAVEGQRSIVAMGSYSDEFQKLDGTWLFSSVRVDFHHVGDVADGWAAATLSR